MRRFGLGVVLGFILATTPAWAGYYYTVSTLTNLRGAPCGDSTYLGYVAGVHDLLAGLYPATSLNLGVVQSKVIQYNFSVADPGNTVGAWAVVGALIDANIVAKEDGLRLLPESWRARINR